METEIVTPEPEAIKKMEETKEMAGGQPATLLSKASLVEDVHSKHAGISESSRGTEELVATQSHNNGVKIPDNEGQDDNSESDSYLELPSLAEKHSEVSQDIEEKDTPVSIQTEGLENGSQIQKDQTGEIVEVAGNIKEGNTTDDNGKEADVSKEQNDDVNVRENLHSESIMATLGSYDQQEGKAEDESEAVIDDIEQKGDDQSYDKLSPIVGNSGGLMNGQKEEDEAVSSSQENTTESKTSREESELNSEEEITVNNVAAKAFNTEEIIDKNLESTIPVKDEGKQAALLVEEIESNEKSTILDNTVEYHETVAGQQEDKNTEHAVESLTEKTSNEHQTGEAENNVPLTENTGSQHSKVEEQWSPADTSVAPMDSQEENNSENAIETETQVKNLNNLIENDDIKEEKFPDESKADKLEIVQKDVQELEPEEMHKDLDHSSIEQVQKGAEIVERHDGESDIIEEDCTAKHLITVSNGEQEENDSVKDNNVAEDPKEEVNEEILVIEDDHNEKQDKDEDIEIQEPSTEATEDKNEVTEEPVIVGADNDVGLPLLEQEVVLDHSTVTNGEEPFKNDQKEVKEIEGLSIVGEDKETDKHILDDDAVEDHPEATSDKEPLEDGHKEEKTRESAIVSSDKDINEPTVVEHIVNNSTEIIEEEPLEDARDEKEETGGLENLDDVEETIVLSDIVPDHSETSIKEEATEDDLKDEKETEEIEIAGVDKSISEPITEEVVPDHSTTITNDESEQYSQEEKVDGGSEIDGVEKGAGEAIKDSDILPDHSETTIVEDYIKEDNGEEKVSEDQEIADEDKKTVEPITRDVSISGYSETTLEEPIKYGHEDEKDDVEQKIVGVDKSVSEPIEQVLYHHSTTVLEDKSVNTSHEEKVSGDSELAAIDKDIQEAVQEEDVVPDYAETAIVDEQIEASHNRDKLNEDQEISVEDKSIIKPITKDVISDYSTTVNEDGHEESKVSGGSQVASDETVEATNVEKDTVPDYSETTLKDEPIKGVDDEVKESEGTDIVGEEKSTGEATTEEVAQDHSTNISGDESAEDSHEEKVSGGLIAAVADTHIGDNVKEEDIFPDRLETPIPEEQIVEVHNEDKVTKEQEIASVSKDIKEPVIEEASFPDYTTEITEDGPEERKVTGESETPGIDNMGEAITEKEISPEDSEATTKEEPIIDDREEEKVSGEPQISSDEAVEATSVEKDTVPEYSETTVKDEAIEDVDDEVKASEETDIIQEKSIEEPITEEVAQNHSRYVSGDEQAEDSHEEKVSGGLVIAVADKEDNVKEEDVFPDHIENPITEEKIEEEPNIEKVTEELEIASVSKDVKEPLVEEAALPDYTTTVTKDDPEESKVTGESQTPGIEDMREAITEKEISPEDSGATIIGVHEEEKVNEELETPSAEATTRNPILEDIQEKDVVPDYSETTTVDEQIEASHNGDKLNEDQEISAEDESIVEPITKEVISDYSTMVNEDGHEESKVSGESQVAETVEATSMEKDTVKDYSETTVKDEPMKDVDEVKASEETDIVGEEKSIGEAITEEVAQDHSTYISGDEPAKDSREEKVSGGLVISVADKDIGDNVKEEDVFPDRLESPIPEEQIEEAIKQQEIDSVSKDIEEPVLEEAAFPDYTTAITEDDPEERKVIGESETPGIDNTREAITEKDISEATTKEEPIIDGHEEEKVAEESQIIGEEKNLEEIPCNSEKEKDTEETEKDSADKDITEAITEEAIVPTCSTTTTEDETIVAAPLIQDIQEREIADDALITELPAVSGSEETTKEDSQKDALEPSKHEVEAKDRDWPMEPAAEDKDSTENVKRVDSVEEENEHKNRDLDNVIETKEEEKVSNDISEDHSDTANELNYERADKTEEIENVHSKDGEDLHEVQETGEHEEPKEEEEMHQESTEMHGETSTLAPFVSEEKTTKEIIEEEKSRNTETVESNDSNVTQKLLEDSEIHDAKPEDIVLPEYGGIPKEEVHNVELQEINHEPEITTSQTQEEQQMHEETSLTQQGETERIKLEETDETDSTELTEQRNIELEPKLESQDEIYHGVVEHGTITSAENKEVCAEPAVADITEDTESAKERSPILEDVTSVNDVKETIDVSHEEEEADSSNSNEEVYEELELVSAKDDAENLTTDTEQTKVDSQEDDGIETPGEEKQAKDSDSETPLEEYTSTKRSTEIDTSTKPLVAEEHDIDEVSEKMSTSNNHESESSTSLTEKLSLHDEELEPEVKEFVHDSDISSKEFFSPAIEGNSTSSRELTVEDLVHKEDVTTSNVLAAETLVADEVEQKQSEIPEEASEVQDKSIIEDVIEGHLVSETYGAKDFEVEGNVKLDKDAEMGVESTEKKISVSESEPGKHVSETQAADVVLDSEESIDTDEFRDDNIVEASELDVTSTGINRETYALEKNATLAQNAEADNPCEEFLKDTESADKDHSHEVLPETEKKNGDIINEQSAEDPTVDESIQEKIRENKDLQEIDAYLDAKDETLEAMSFEKPSDFASQTFNNEKTDQESGLVEENVELESYLSAGDQNLDELMSPEKSTDLVSQVPTLNNEKCDQDSTVVEKNVEDIIEKDMPVQNTEESSQKVEDIIESGILVKNTKEISEDNLEDIIESDIPVKNTEESFEKNVEDVFESDIPIKNINESYKKNVEDVIKSDIPVKDTEESSENDQKYDEASIAREFNEPTELVHQEKTNDDIPIAPSLDEETSLGDVGGASAEEILQEGKEEDVINKAIYESIDDGTNKSNEEALSDEVPKNLDNASDIQNDERQSLGETEAAKVSFQEFSSDNTNLASLKEGEGKGDKVDEEAAILVNDEQVSESNALKSTGDDTYEAKAPENDILNEEVPEGSEDPLAGHNFGKQETEEGVLEDPNFVTASRESVQLTQKGADVEGEGAKELSTTSEPEQLSSEKESVEDLTDDSSNAKENNKNEIAHEMLTSHEVVFLEEEIINQEDFTGRPVTFVVKTEQNVPTEETPVLVSKHLEEESVDAPEELTHETLSKEADVEGRIPKDASDTESFIEVEKPADCISVSTPMSTMESSPTKGEIPTDNASISSLTEIPQEEIQEKEGNCTKGGEKQEMTYTKKGTNEESGEEIKREILLVQTSEDMKTSELDLQEKSCANEEGEPQLSILQETYDAPAAKQISLEAEPIKKTEENGSDSNTDVSSFPIGVTEKSLEEDEIDDVKHGEAQGHDSQLKDAKYNADKELNRFDETVTDVNLTEDGVSSSDVMDKSSNPSLQTDGQSEEGIPPQYKRLQSNKELTIEIKDAEKTDQKEKDEEGEEDEDEDNEDHKKDDSGSDAPVMVEASKDIDIKTTPKKSHGILHGVGSKVKHSISKVKKAITGKSSPHKQSSPSPKS